MSVRPHIAIIGAGPAGLTLAAVLTHQGSPLPTAPQITIYERSTQLASCDQGGTLDLHLHTGQRAVHAAGLFDAFERLARYEGEAMKLLDKTGKVYMDLVEDGRGTRPEIDRGALNALLLTALPEGLVQWGSVVQRVEPVSGDSGRQRVILTDGRMQEVDLVVGADGAWSKTRSLLTKTQPQYSGITMIEVRFSDVDNRLPTIAKIVGPGTLGAFSDNKGIIGQRLSGSAIRAYLLLRVPSDWATSSSISWTSASAARPSLLPLYSDWIPELRALIEECDEEGIWARAIYETPPAGVAWSHRTGLTLMGDAAHLMTPNAGMGANMAMLDGAELGEAILEGARAGGEQWLEKAVRKYEDEMFPRARAAIEQSRSNTDAFVSEYAPAGMKEIIEGMFERMQKAPKGTAPSPVQV